MPTQKDLKRLVRTRMRKTGEAYTAARAQIINKSKAPAVTPIPAKIDYARLAGMSDAKVKDATGCTWERWVYALDRRKAYELSHAELAKLIKAKYDTPAWWTQTVAVGYERIKGLRARGQGRDGNFAATKSRTFKVPVETLFEAWSDAKQRNKWFADKNLRIRKATAPKSIRLEQDGAIIAVGFTKLGPTKSSVAVEESKLPSREAAAEVKKYWGQRFDDLAALLGPG
jgi:uncharacterized protein YndB with AHSA1/START domain